MRTEEFDCFQVHKLQNRYSFFHIEIEDTDVFYEKLFNYFFSEDKLLRYCENSSAITFRPSKRNYVTLFKHLKIYVDSENLEKDVSELECVLLAVLQEEMHLEDSNGKKLVRLDKMGKIGEYLFCCLLSDYFHFECIIPKVHLQTDYNMSVYGIDTLYYSPRNDLLLFGESKVSLRLDNGVHLVNTSLKGYEKQLEDEFCLVLSNRLYKNKLDIFSTRFGDIADVTLSIQDFIRKARISQIGVPIFIAHGTETSKTEIFKKLAKIRCQNFFNLHTKYYLISLPVIDKNKLIVTFTKMIREKGEYYESITKR
jgi:hypothetical protein